MSDQRNFILAIALSIGIVLLWSFLFPPKPKPLPEAATQAETSAPTILPGLEGGLGVAKPRSEVIAASPRLKIEAPEVSGSLSLVGARIDDLKLKTYRETTDAESANITVLSPLGTTGSYYGEFGWRAAEGARYRLPDQSTVWTLEAGERLAPGAPVTLKWDNGAGLIFRQKISVDDHFLFEVVQSVENNSGSDVALSSYGLIARYGDPAVHNIWIVHEGFLGVLGGSLKERKYKAVRDEGLFSQTSTGGWLGFTDMYWMTAILPPQDQSFLGSVGLDKPGGMNRYLAAAQLNSRIIPSGGRDEVKSHFFAGAKKVSVIDAYEKQHGIAKFDLAIDWGWFWFLTKPLFYLLEIFYHLVGNFGVSILIVTVLIKLAFFPLANRSYEAMSKMKKLQPVMKDLQDRYKDDRMKMQQELMELYRKEKVNPVAGCLPVLIQIPVFFALYKVLYVTIDMRHAPFFGWIQDLSAKDPTSLFNLFGALPYDVPGFLVIGAWPLIMGLTMYVQTALNPAPADPIQKQIFALMPIMFTVMLAAFPAGLVIYWTWNNILSILQQYVIMRRMGTPVDLGKALGFELVQRALSGARSRPGGSDPAP